MKKVENEKQCENENNNLEATGAAIVTFNLIRLPEFIKLDGKW